MKTLMMACLVVSLSICSVGASQGRADPGALNPNVILPMSLVIGVIFWIFDTEWREGLKREVKKEVIAYFEEKSTFEIYTDMFGRVVTICGVPFAGAFIREIGRDYDRPEHRLELLVGSVGY